MRERAELARQRQQCLAGQCTGFVDDRGEERSVEVLEREMRSLRVQIETIRPRQGRMRESGQGLRLTCEAGSASHVPDQFRPEHLDHDRCKQLVVPREIDLVARPAAESVECDASGRDLIAAPETPTHAMCAARAADSTSIHGTTVPVLDESPMWPALVNH
jgi:hypothetical protein